jgi:DNA-binding HxlR family transcriptional regulator
MIGICYDWYPMTKKKYNCPAELTISLIGGKWKAILLYNLRSGPRRFGDLKRHSPGITQATLTQQLRELESSGLIKRALIGQDKLAGVEYSLTDKGMSLRPIINLMIRWGIAHQKDYAVGAFGMEVFQN